MKLELHPLCVLFPRLVGSEFESLKADIAANGLRSPIVLHDGMILDGGNRYRACIEAGVEPTFAPFAGENIVSFVLSANLHRRHLLAGQHAAIVGLATDWARVQQHGGDRRSEQAATLPLETVADRAAASGASERTQRMADKVTRADPELAKRVAHGEVSLPKAVERVEGKPPKVVAAKTAKQVEAEQVAEAAHSGFDPLEDLKEAELEIQKLTAELKAAEADDPKAEVLKWRRAYDNAMREQSKYMDLCEQAKKREAKIARQLQRCGKMVGEDDPDKIAPAVESFVRKHSKVAA